MQNKGRKHWRGRETSGEKEESEMEEIRRGKKRNQAEGRKNQTRKRRNQAAGMDTTTEGGEGKEIRPR